MVVKGRAKKRNMYAVAIEQRRAKVAELYLAGSAQWQIAEAVGVSTVLIGLDLKALRAEWRESAGIAFAERQALELAKVDQLEAFAWEMLRKSAEDAEADHKEVEKQLRAAQGSNGQQNGPYRLRVVKELTKHVRKDSGGSPAWAAQILECVSVRCRILGVIKPDQNTTNVSVAVINWGSLLGQLNQAGAGPDPVEGRISQALEGPAEGSPDGDAVAGPGPSPPAGDCALADAGGPGAGGGERGATELPGGPPALPLGEAPNVV